MKVQVLRNQLLESEHQVDWVAMNFAGEIVGSSGDIQQKIFPRSAIKMIQVLPFLKKKFEMNQSISDEEIACACASHSGESQHLHVVDNWLKRLNLNSEHLHCGPQPPYDESTWRQMLESKIAPTRLHNNCSGKHTAMLEYSQLLGADVKSYYDVNHPVQKEIRSLISSMANEDILEWGTDGCGIPTWRFSLVGFARVMSRFGQQSLKENTIEQKVFKAFTRFPELTSGHKNFCAQVMVLNPEKILVKVGAEGMMTAVLADKKISIVLKTKDGTKRAAEVAIAALIEKFNPELKSALNPFAQPKIFNWAGEAVGSINTIHTS